MKKLLIAATLTLASIVVSAALAQAPTVTSVPRADDAFKRLDANQDSYLSKDEVAKSRIANHFDQLDIDHDGKLSAAELQAGRKDMKGRMHGQGSLWQQADTNKDGQLSKAELNQFVDNRFDKADTNKDGVLSKDELHTVREGMRGWHHDRHGDNS